MSVNFKFPFHRVSVDHLVVGHTRVWWQLEPSFRDAGPYQFQLQFGRTGTNQAVDWENVGAAVIDGTYADDPDRHEWSHLIHTNYRVVLTTPTGEYVSEPANCFGDLAESDWTKAHEILRKERLLMKVGTGRSGVLFIRKRFGPPCEFCIDPLTDDSVDCDCPYCNGTGFRNGFFAPIPYSCFTATEQTVVEQQDGQQRGTVRDQLPTMVRVPAFPMVHKLDVFVDTTTDERFLVHAIKYAASVRSMPVVLEVEMRPAATSEVVYNLQVGGEPASTLVPVLHPIGDGTVAVDHNYGGDDALAYTRADGCGISGAMIRAFLTTDYANANGSPAVELAVLTTSTMANGRWAEQMKLAPGDYTFVFHKVGEYGPDAIQLTIS